MTHPGGPGGPGPEGPGGNGPPRNPTAAEIVAAIDGRVIAIAASLPDPSPSQMAKVADIFRRSWQRLRYHKAA